MFRKLAGDTAFRFIRSRQTLHHIDTLGNPRLAPAKIAAKMPPRKQTTKAAAAKTPNDVTVEGMMCWRTFSSILLLNRC